MEEASLLALQPWKHLMQGGLIGGEDVLEYFRKKITSVALDPKPTGTRGGGVGDLFQWPTAMDLATGNPVTE